MNSKENATGGRKYSFESDCDRRSPDQQEIICPATEEARLIDDDVAKSRSRARSRISDADSRGYLLETGESQFLVGRVSIRVYFKIRNTCMDNERVRNHVRNVRKP